MKHFNTLLTAALLFGYASGAWPHLRNSQPASKPALYKNEIDSGNFNLADLLDHNTPKAEVYLRARAELQTIGKRSSCHQIVLKVYMKHCQLLEEFESHAGDRLQDYIDSFAASLAICDLQAADANIPSLCDLFQEQTLQSIIISSNTQGLHASREQVGHCLKGLHSDQNSWVSFNGNKETANSLCRTAKDDIARDNFLSKLYAMTNVLEDIGVEEEQRKKDRIEDQLSTKRFFQNLRDQTSDVMSGVLNMWQNSIGVTQSLTEALQSASLNAQAVEVAVMRILKNLVEGNAEHAYAQQNAAAATSDLMIANQNASIEIRQLMAEIRMRMTAMDSAQSTREQHYVEVMDNQLNHVKNHTKAIVDELYQAMNITSKMKNNVEEVVNSLSNLSVSTNPTSPWGISWPLLIICPLLTILIIGHGIPASYTRNIGLLILGIFIAKLLTLLMNAEWQMDAPSPFTTAFNNPPATGLESDNSSVAAIAAD